MLVAIFSLLLAAFSALPLCQASGNRLNIFVRHYEPLFYDALDVHQSHIRAKRSTSGRPDVRVRFHGHNREFHLRLKHDASVFHRDIVMETAEHGVVKPETKHIYTGWLAGDPSSHVYGALHDGVFEGGIQTRNDTYYVESARKYFDHATPFHSVLYSARDVDITGGKGGSFCGLNAYTHQWMESVYRGIVPQKLSRHTKVPPYVRFGRRLHSAQEESDVGGMLDVSDQGIAVPADQDEANNVTGRAASASRRVCNLEINIDHLLYAKYFEPDQDDRRTRERLSAMIAAHMIKVNKVYRSTDFKGVEDISFVVQRININDSSNCIGPKAASNPFCKHAMSINEMLNYQSQQNHDDFCLSYAWTYRDFADGTLGLAWISEPPSRDPLGQSGGVCQKYKPSVKPGTRELLKLGLNTGIVSFINYNNFVPQVVSELTVCHEIGHNFGSPHDNGTLCAPGGNDGNYIMFWAASKGNLKNNDKFSLCTIGNVSAVLGPLVRGESNRENCFQEDSGPICGNGITEGEEQCDCGMDERECTDKCCYPRHSSNALDTAAKGCKLRGNVKCSPTAGPCCSPDCGFLGIDILCLPEKDCTAKVTCSGNNASCPAPVHKPDGTECNNKTQVCSKGECTGSICEKHGLYGCTLTDRKYSIDEQCLVACKQTADEKAVCKPACEFPAMKPLCGLKMMPGSPCSDLNGYCDVFQKCRLVDAEGPLSRLQKALFGEKNIGRLKEYVTTHVGGTVVILLVALAMLILLIHCCAVHTPSSHPQKKHEREMRKLRKRFGTTAMR